MPTWFALHPTFTASLVALALLLVPAACGWFAGRTVRATWPRRPRARVLGPMVALPLIAASTAYAYNREIGVCDAILAACIAGASLSLGVAQFDAPRRRTARTFVLGAGVLLVVVEITWRIVGPPSDRASHDLPPPLTTEPERLEWWVPALYPDVYDHDWFPALRDPRTIPRPAGVTRFVHLGDSLIEQRDVPPDARTTTVLDAMHAGEQHLDLGLSNTGTDVQWAVLHAWLARLRPDAVVWYPFAGNDLEEIGRPMAACGMKPPVTIGAGGPAFTCGARPHWTFPLGYRLHHDPPPYFVRVFAGRSATVSLLRTLDTQFRADEAPDRGPGSVPAFVSLARAMAAECARAGVPFVAVPMPLRNLYSSSAATDGPAERRATVAAALAQAGVRVFDPTDELYAAMRADPSQRWFQARPGNPHLDTHGTRWLAAWLDRTVLPALRPNR